MLINIGYILVLGIILSLVSYASFSALDTRENEKVFTDLMWGIGEEYKRKLWYKKAAYISLGVTITLSIQFIIILSILL
ncbi:hypothetical protein ZZ1p0088 [Acinetobacter phage ZZ1]|jgi:hypothetical protein|uniref:Uncharacterized protein n=3 Tax=Caudoviricetes TaxID=2731619 RepID=A0A410T5M2_9CAUD|nr:hypothetical protein ZZ1p0088 [Acinetobacter phage ZZ1]AFL47519.1 hypothetical protein ZZ1p0088 [Acinetobacter phage ZZ1]QAU03944.1 hypothetical protein Henu6_gp139 [Acinetobacter phage Henu6]